MARIAGIQVGARLVEGHGSYIGLGDEFVLVGDTRRTAETQGAAAQHGQSLLGHGCRCIAALVRVLAIDPTSEVGLQRVHIASTRTRAAMHRHPCPSKDWPC